MLDSPAELPPQVDLDAELAYLTFRANQPTNDALLFL